MIELPFKEKIIVLTRRHPITLILKIGSAFLLLLISIFVIILFVYGFKIFEIPPAFLFSLITFLILFYFIFAFIYFTNWYLDVWIITEKRVIDIEQINLFNSQFSEFTIDKVQDVTINRIGFLANIFDFGDVHIQTAGMFQTFILKEVPNPQNIKSLLMKCIEKVKIK